jgi:hypothetical protein
MIVMLSKRNVAIDDDDGVMATSNRNLYTQLLLCQ